MKGTSRKSSLHKPAPEVHDWKVFVVLWSALLILVPTGQDVRCKQIPNSEDSTGEIDKGRGVPMSTLSGLIGLGVGSTLGMRLELGMTIAGYVSIGTAFTRFDSWSNGSQDTKYGMFLRLNVPISSLAVTPYVQLMGGMRVFRSFSADSYSSYAMGVAVPLSPTVSLRPELAMVNTNRVVSHRIDYLFRPTKPGEYEEGSTASLSVTLELHF